MKLHRFPISKFNRVRHGNKRTYRHKKRLFNSIRLLKGKRK